MGTEHVERVESISGVRRAQPAVAEWAVRSQTKEKVLEKAKVESAAVSGTKEQKGAVNLPGQTYAQFIVDDRTGHVSVKIIDSITQEVVREIPPESMSKLAEDMVAYQNLASERRRHVAGK